VPVLGYRNAGDDWSPDAKLAVVIETASMSEAELGAYCRQKGLYSEQVQRWKEARLHGTGLQEGQEKAAQKQQRDARGGAGARSCVLPLPCPFVVIVSVCIILA